MQHDTGIKDYVQIPHTPSAKCNSIVPYLALALRAQTSVALAQDLAVLRQIVLKRKHVDVANGVQVDLVALQLSAAASALEFPRARAISLRYREAFSEWVAGEL